ncbi:hypothetical protein OOU_Y34scaffold00334g19 [Pyricularia oryzae Y34]|uniref:Copper acquisition factor BIM1-like domain-containing protein n=2 Tax=Pyricularia oryzae TaxID=318829 RepID=A0AA97PNA8_PYRO3|nr:hypothetical protein OOU_Y34scaffold00334g19 [Pyricularia oryzae Y34]
MQWIYPCGGINLTQNRTYWSTKGGAVALQPGWFQGHQTATLYVNLGIGNKGPDGGPLNMSLSMVPAFGISGPSKNPYPGTICLPQVSLPQGYTPEVGENATIQVVELAVHGAALFSPLTDTKCPWTVANTNITSTSAAAASLRQPGGLAWYAGWIPMVGLGAWALL